MRRLLLLLTILALVVAPEVVGAQDIRINPVPPGVQTSVDPGPRGAPGLLGPQPPHRRFPLWRQILFLLGKLLLSRPGPGRTLEVGGEGARGLLSGRSGLFQDREKSPGRRRQPRVEPTPSPKAKIIDIPPSAPPEQAPAEVAPQDTPGPEETPAPPPKVM